MHSIRAGDLLRQLRAQRSGAAHDRPHRREVVLVDRRVLGERERDRRDDIRAGDAVLGDQAEELIEVEAGHRHDRRAGAQTLVHDHRHPVDVEERQHADQGVVGLDRERVLDLPDVGDQVRVREHHPLGQAGGAARVGQHRQVGGRVDLDLGRRVGVAEQVAERLRPLGLPEHVELVGDPGPLGRLPSRLVERRHGDQDLRARVLELVGELVRGVERVGRGRLAPRRGGAVKGDRVLGDVGHVDGEHVAVAEAALGEPRRERADPARELGVGDRAAAGTVDQRGLVAPLRGLLEHERGHVRLGYVDLAVAAAVDHTLSSWSRRSSAKRLGPKYRAPGADASAS